MTLDAEQIILQAQNNISEVGTPSMDLIIQEVMREGPQNLGTFSNFGFLTTGVIIFLIVLAILAFIGVYVYHALAWQRIAKRLKYKKAWLAWIPIANLFLFPILAGKKWTWGFMFLVPIANIVFFMIWYWRIFERRNEPGWPSLFVLIPYGGSILYLISIGILAWKKK